LISIYSAQDDNLQKNFLKDASVYVAERFKAFAEQNPDVAVKYMNFVKNEEAMCENEKAMDEKEKAMDETDKAVYEKEKAMDETDRAMDEKIRAMDEKIMSINEKVMVINEGIDTVEAEIIEFQELKTELKDLRKRAWKSSRKVRRKSIGRAEYHQLDSYNKSLFVYIKKPHVPLYTSYLCVCC
jgi:uncharacterized protein (DUF3084 family)